MTDYKVGDIALVPFPFTDLKTNKKRPALILSHIVSKTLPDLFIVSMITSQIESESILGDYSLMDWQTAGLLNPSKVRLAKIVSLEEALILRRLGKLQKKDFSNLRKEVAGIFGEWVD